MTPLDPDTRHMERALRQAHRAAEEGEVPVGAVIILGDELLGQARNQVETLKDPTAHAEMLAITQAASALGDWRLTGATLYITKEPCPMCAGAIVQARLERVVWAMDDPRRGGHSLFSILNNPALNHRPRIETGLLEEEARQLIQAFFSARRQPEA